MQRRRIVNCRTDTLALKRCQQGVPAWALDNKLIVDMSPLRSLNRQTHRSESVGSKQPAIGVGIVLPGSRPGIQMPQFDA